MTRVGSADNVPGERRRRRARLCVAAIACLLAAGCSGCGNAASAPADATAAPPDVSPPPPPAVVVGYQWQRDLDKLLMGYTHAVMTSSGVLVVNDGRVYLYDTSGNEVAHAAWVTGSSAFPTVYAVLVRSSGNVAIAFVRDDSELVVIEYSLPDLSKVYETEVVGGAGDAALVERDGVLYALCSTGSSFNLYQLDDGGNVVKTTALATVPDDQLEGVGAVATDGTILACADQAVVDPSQHDKVTDEFTSFLRIDPATGKVTTLRLGDAGSHTCDLVRGRNHLLAAWPDYDKGSMQWAILDQDGTKILARGGAPPSATGTDFAYEDGRFLMIGLSADPEIYAIDENTAAPLGPFHLRYGLGEQFNLYSEGIAADGRQVYAAFLVADVLRLQKLDPLPRQ